MKNIRQRGAVFGLAVSLVGLIAMLQQAFAQDVPQEMPEGGRLARMSFAAIDRSGDGFVHMGDMEEFRDLVFVSMDADENDEVSAAEFMNWDFGFVGVAEESDAVVAYHTAIKIVFGLWDRDGDGGMTPSEHRHAIAADFQHADLNGDAVLTESEFLGGFSIMVALRAALKPD